MGWGFCSSGCSKTDKNSEAGNETRSALNPDTVKFHESAGQTFPKTTANEVLFCCLLNNSSIHF